MMKLLVLTVCFGLALAAPQKSNAQFRNLYKPTLELVKPPTGRIIDGVVAKPHSIPHQAFLGFFNESGSWYCGGSLITTNRILTAGQCCYKAVGVRVILGAESPLEEEESQTIFDVWGIHIHSTYSPATLRNDICLIKLDEDVKLNEFIAVIPIETKDDASYVDKKATISGWGTDGDIIPSKVLTYTENTIISNDVCDSTFGGLVSDEQICLSGKGSEAPCAVDVGGPLTIDGVQVGILSYGTKHCLQGYPSVYTRIGSYLRWIDLIG